MNYIIFNHDGSIKNVNFAEIIVQGNNLVDEIFVAVEGRSTDSYLATAYFELPNGDSNFLTATLASHSIDQSAYNGYKFLLTGAQTAFYGRVRMSLKLEGMQGETLWTYEQVLTINKSGYDPDFTMISMSQYAALLQAMGSLQEKYVVNNARFYSSLANAQADLDNLAFNQCVIIADTSATDPIPEIYFKNSESQLELLAGIGEYTFQAGTTTTQTLAPGSDATVSVSFVASGKTITMNFTFGIPRGNTGATGNGIASIEKYSTEGQVDTYRITYTNGSHFDFDVTNGTLAGHLLSSTFEYDDERIDSLSMQLAAEIRRLVDADGSKVKSIMASKPTSEGGVQTYSIVWDYNVNIIPGALNVEDGDFYFENDGVLTSIDSHLEDYTFSIFHEIEGTSVEDFGYIEIVDTAKVGSGTLTQAELVELRKPISFIRYQTGVRSYDMLISYYSARQANNTISKYFRGFMHKGSEDFDSAYAYNLSRSFITVTNLDSTTTGGWSYTLNVDAYVDKTPTQNSTNLVTSGGVHSAVSTLDAKISKNAEDIAALTEALIKKDLYETQEATFQGMTPVPAGALVKAYLDGFKGNSAVVNQLVNVTRSTTTTKGVTFTISNGIVTLSGTATEDITFFLHSPAISLKANVNYLLAGCPKGGSSATYQLAAYYLSPDNGDGSVSYTSTSRTDCYVYISIKSGTNTNGLVFKPQLIDLSIVLLTSAEMADVATVKAALKHKGMDVDYYIPYNAGTLTDSKPTKLISYGYNLCDGEVEGGAYWGANGEKTSSQNAFRAANKFKCFGAVLSTIEWALSLGVSTISIFYWDKNDVYINYYSKTVATNSLTFLPPSNCAKISFGFSKSDSGWGSNPPTKAEAQLCFHLASASLGYKPHVPAIEYDLTLPYLKSAGSVQDESKAGGSKVNTKDLGAIDYTYSATIGGGVFYGEIADIKVGTTVAGIESTLCEIYTKTNSNPSTWGSLDKVYVCGSTYINGKYIVAKDTTYNDAPTFKTGVTGKKINYERNTPTDFSSTISYPEIVDVYAGGSVEVVGEGCDATTKVYFYVEA